MGNIYRIAVGCIVLFSMSFGQLFQVDSVYYYDGITASRFNSVATTTSGDLIACGRGNTATCLALIQHDDYSPTWIVNFDSLGHRIELHSVAQSAGHFISLGTITQSGTPEIPRIFLTSNSGNGSLEWTQTIEPSGINTFTNHYDYGTDLIELADGNLVILGTTVNNTSVVNKNIYLRKIDPSGQIIWEKGINHEIPNPNDPYHPMRENTAVSLAELPNGNLALLATTNVGPVDRMQLHILNSVGTLIETSEVSIPDVGNYFRAEGEISVHPDGDLLISTISCGPNTTNWAKSLCVMKISQAGAFQWAYLYPSTNTGGQTICSTEDGSIVAGGYAGSGQIILELSSSGEYLQHHQLDQQSSFSENCFDIILGSNGRLIAAGDGGINATLAVFRELPQAYYVSIQGSNLSGDGSMSAPFSTIQFALNQCESGDTVLVDWGTYYENIFWPETNGIKLISLGDPGNTIIDGGGVSSVIYINPTSSHIDSSTEISNFGITNGGNTSRGSGLFISGASPRIYANLISNNHSSLWGGGVFISGTTDNLKIEDCVILENSSSSAGGGIYIENSTVSITQSTVSRNYTTWNTATWGDGIYVNNSDVFLQGVTVAGHNVQAGTNYGAGIYLLDNSQLQADNCVIENNAAFTSTVLIGGNSVANMSNTIIRNNIAVGILGNSVALSDCQISGNVGGGMNVTEANLINVLITDNHGIGLILNGTGSLNQVEIMNNVANSAGGFSLRGTVTLQDVFIIGNHATVNGGGLVIGRSGEIVTAENVFICDNTTDGMGGGIVTSYSDSTLLSGITIAHNYAAINGSAIFLGTDSDIHISEVTIFENYGGAGSSAIHSNSLIDYELGNTPSPSINNSNFVGNKNAINNTDNSVVIDAMNNYWGNPSGPFHPVQNALGQGDSTNAFVNISPWLSIPVNNAPPIPPSNVAVHGSGNDFLSLHWDSSSLSDFAGYVLYYDTDESGYPYANSIDIGTDTVFTIFGLSEGTQHFLALTIYDTNGNESWYSEGVIGTTRIMELQNLDIAGDEDLSHIVSHHPIIIFEYFDSMAESQTAYQLQISTDSLFQNEMIWDTGIVSTSATSVEYSGDMLNNGASYYLRGKVASGFFWSEWSALSFRMNTEPSAPELLSPANGDVITTQPILRFLKSNDAEEDILAYSVYLYSTEEMVTPLDSLINYTGMTDTISWTVSVVLDDNAQLRWRVKAYDGYEYNSLSEMSTFLFNISNDTPNEFLLISPINEIQVTSLNPLFTWHSSSDVDPQDTVNYVLYLDTPEPGVETYDIGLDTSYQVITDLIDNTDYSWKVIASDLNDANTENTGGYQFFRVNTVNDLPTAFNLLAPEHESMVPDLTPTLIWEPSSDPDDGILLNREVQPIHNVLARSTNSTREITAYQVYLDTDSLFTETYPVEVFGAEYAPDIELLENMIYYWKIEAVDDDGGTLFSNRFSFWTNAQNDIPDAFSMIDPIGTPLLELTSLTPTFTWNSASDADLNDELIYHLKIGTSTWDMEEVYVGSDTSWNPTELLWDNTVYSWEVLAEDLAGAITAAGIGDSIAFAHFHTNIENENPEPAVLLSPDSVVVLTNTPTFIWERSFDPDPFESIEYEVHWWYAGSEWDSVITEETSVTISNPLVEDNQQYFWQVISMDDQDGISQSEDYMFWVDFLPEPPGLFVLTGPEDESAGNSTQPELTWQAAIDPDPFDNVYYQVTIATDSLMEDIVHEGIVILEDYVLPTDLENDTRYYWQVLALDEDSFETVSDIWTFDVGYLAIDDDLSLPTEFVLDQNFPNPFNPSTTLRYGIPEDVAVTLIIYDIRGNVVKLVDSGTQVAGWYEHIWNGMDESGQQVSTGLYLTRLQAGSYSKVIKMLFLK